MTLAPEHLKGVTTHSRRGAVRNAFRYGVDFVLIAPDSDAPGPALFSRNRFNLASVHDRDHGGPLKQGVGVGWVKDVLSDNGCPVSRPRILLLTQPSYLGYAFNPVSFWLAYEGDALIAVIAEVSTPFGDRHSYLCHAPGFAPIDSSTRIHRPKALHVSPFQEVAGSYEFAFDIRPDQIAIRILFRNGDAGVTATLSGQRQPLSNRALVAASLRRPLGAFRTIALIHWQALLLKLKGARYRRRPAPPEHEVT